MSDQAKHETGDDPDRSLRDERLDDFKPVKSGSRDNWVQSEEPDFKKPGESTRDELLRE